MPIDIATYDESRKPRIDPTDVAETLAGLSGRYAALDIYRRYSDIAEAAGREPAPWTLLGPALRKAGAATARGAKGVRLWVIP